MAQNNIITAERRRMAPYIERVNGFTAREELRGAFDGAAGRYLLGRIDDTEFRAITAELIRDAAGLTAEQDRKADARQPWATVPTDGSGGLTRWQWALLGVIVVTCLLAMVRITGLIWQDWSTVDESRDPVPVTVAGTPAGVGAPDRDAARELIMEGAYLSWQAQGGCSQGPAECERVLREINANPYGVRFFEDGTAFAPGRE
ncbi:hypothetical protein ACFW2V_13345 [Streptomyces sp. NPDC058947]|uniref:hypothetical protein n=1 Tax=Streptomyces sp. NPDC058947 TaxID=3346675 RepID=UPI0036816EB1